MTIPASWIIIFLGLGGKSPVIASCSDFTKNHGLRRYRHIPAGVQVNCPVTAFGRHLASDLIQIVAETTMPVSIYINFQAERHQQRVVAHFSADSTTRTHVFLKEIQMDFRVHIRQDNKNAGNEPRRSPPPTWWCGIFVQCEWPLPAALDWA